MASLARLVRPLVVGHLVLATAAVAQAAPAAAEEQTPLAGLVARLLASDPGGGRRKAVERIAHGPWSFDEVYRELREHRSYAADVKVGLVEGSHSVGGLTHPYLLVVPRSYTPTRRYPVRVHLHGAVDRNAEAQIPQLRRPERFLSEDRITILPAAWSESRWWQASQVENVTGILRTVKRTYNVDENRVSLMGISDGGTGTWYFAFRCPTPWASYLSFIGSPSVLANPSSGTQGAIFLVNLAGKSILAINGKTDTLYPAEALRPAMEAFRKAGADVTFEVEPGGHDTEWWPRRAGQIDAFVDAHPRDPLPDRVAWATDRTDRAKRSSWVVIDELDQAAPKKLAVLGDEPRHSGGVSVVRLGNTVEAVAIGVRRYRLLLSPEKFDFGRDVVVSTNGRESFRGRVVPSLYALLEWAAEDVDRAMLFAAQLEIVVPRALSPVEPR